MVYTEYRIQQESNTKSWYALAANHDSVKKISMFHGFLLQKSKTIGISVSMSTSSTVHGVCFVFFSFDLNSLTFYKRRVSVRLSQHYVSDALRSKSEKKITAHGMPIIHALISLHPYNQLLHYSLDATLLVVHQITNFINSNPLAFEMAVIAFMMTIANDNNWRLSSLVWRKSIFHFGCQFNRSSAHCRVRAIYVHLQCVHLWGYIDFTSSYAYDTHHILILFNATWLFPRLIGKKYMVLSNKFKSPLWKSSSTSWPVILLHTMAKSMKSTTFKPFWTCLSFGQFCFIRATIRHTSKKDKIAVICSCFNLSRIEIELNWISNYPLNLWILLQTNYTQP